MKNEKLYAPWPFEDVGYRCVSRTQDKKRGQFAFYIDARMVMDRLDEAGCEWSDEYVLLPDGKHVECRLTVDGVTRCDVGEPNDGGHADEFKGAYSDALKRAAVKFGMGRYLYEGRRLWLDINEYGDPTPEGVKKLRSEYDALCAGTGPSERTEQPEAAPEREGASAPSRAPQRRGTGGMGMTQLFSAARRLGFTGPKVLAVASELTGGDVKTLAGWTDEQLDTLFAELKRRAAAAA